MFSENFVRLRKAQKLTQDYVAQYLDIKRQTYSAYERGISVPDAIIVGKLATLFHVSCDVLLGRQGTTHSGRQVPIFPKIPYGISMDGLTDVLGYEEISLDLSQKGDFFALEIQGNSMNPRMAQGDVVIVRLQEEIESGKVGVVMVNENDATVKKVVKHQGGGISLIPFNPTYAPKFYTPLEVENLPVRVLGQVVELRVREF